MKRGEGAVIIALAMLVAGCGEPEGPPGGETPKEPVTVYEYTPAPGQFIGEKAFEGVTNPKTACELAQEYLNRPKNGSYVSLGGFGGYIVVGFGKSIPNGEGGDFSVTGNQNDRSSEPGVVWVMADENGNGKPDDTWYELRGSETGKEGTIRGYEVTYIRPADGKNDVPWTDSEGGRGFVWRMDKSDDPDERYHTQPNYYPPWVAADSYTLTGTRLKPNTVLEGPVWNNKHYEWGYVDNMGKDRGTGSDARKNFFDISNAIDNAGEPVVLSSIDYIKVQSAINHHVGALGEVSTEVRGFATIPRPE